MGSDMRRCRSVVVLVLGCVLASSAPADADTARAKRAESDAQIFMAVAATDAQIAGVRSFLAHSPDVRRFVFLDKKAALKEFEHMFRKDKKLTDNVTADALPVSFRVYLVRPSRAKALAASARTLAGVDTVNVTTPPTRNDAVLMVRSLVCSDVADVDLEVFVRVDATAAQEAQIRAALQADGSVTAVHYVSKDDALKAFRCLFPGNRFRGATAAELPASFELTAVLVPNSIPDLEARLSALDGVENVTTPDLDLHLGREQCRDHGFDLQVFMQSTASPGQVALVRRALRADSDITATRYVSKDAALANLRCVLRYNRPLSRLVTKEMVTTSFEVQVPQASPSDVLARLVSLSGVEIVQLRTIRPPT
jgi:cell division protein FtsX